MKILYNSEGNNQAVPKRKLVMIMDCIPVVGSSAKMTDGLAINSQASDRRFFSPPLMPRTFASPTMESAQLTFKLATMITIREKKGKKLHL